MFDRARTKRFERDTAKFRAGTIALRSEGDIVFYALGTGEYDELNCKC